MMEAPSVANEIKAGVAAVIAFGTALFGWVGWTIIIWICAMLLDYITGSVAALSHGEWSSSIARQGLWHKLGSVASVLVAALSDIAISVIFNEVGGDVLTFTYPAILTPVVCLWYILTELGSTIENAGKLGAPVPKWLQRMISQFRQKIDKTQDAAIPDDSTGEK